MSNQKTNVYEIPLNAPVTLSESKNNISMFNGFYKNNGMYLDNKLLPLYQKESENTASSITIGNDIYTFENDIFYKNGKALKDYSGKKSIVTTTLGDYTYHIGSHYQIDKSIYDVNGNLIFTIETGALRAFVNNVFIIESGTPSNNEYILYREGTEIARCIGYTIQQTNLYILKDNGILYIVLDSTISTTTTSISNFNKSDFDIVCINNKLYLYYKSATSQYKGILLNGMTKTNISHNNNGAYTDSLVQPLTKSNHSIVKEYSSEVNTRFLKYKSYLYSPYKCRNADYLKNGTLNGYMLILRETGSVTNSSIHLGTNKACVLNNDKSSAYDFYAYPTATLPVTEPVYKSLALANNQGINVFGLKDENNIPFFITTKIGNFTLVYINGVFSYIEYNNHIVSVYNLVNEDSLYLEDNNNLIFKVGNTFYKISISNEKYMTSMNNIILFNILDKENAFDGTSFYCYSQSGTIINKSSFGYKSVLLSLKYFNAYYTNLQSWTDFLNNTNIHNNLNIKIGNGVVFAYNKNPGVVLPSMICPYSEYSVIYQGLSSNVEQCAYVQANQTPQDLLPFPRYQGIQGNLFTFDNSMILKAFTVKQGELYSGNSSILSYTYSFNDNNIYTDNKLVGSTTSITSPTYYNLSINIDNVKFISGFNTLNFVNSFGNSFKLITYEGSLKTIYTLQSGLFDISEYFVLNGQSYCIQSGYIYSVDLIENDISNMTPITEVQNLVFIGNTDTNAYFYSLMKKSVYVFNATNTLNFMSEATNVDENIKSYFNKQTNEIFLKSKTGYYIIGETVNHIETDGNNVTFGKETFSIGNKSYSYFNKPGFDVLPINLETLWYGDVTKRENIIVDTVYIELESKGKLDIEYKSIIDGKTAVTKKSIENVYINPDTGLAYIRFQPGNQGCSMFKLNISTNSPIKRIAVSVKNTGTSTISSFNI